MDKNFSTEEFWDVIQNLAGKSYSGELTPDSDYFVNPDEFISVKKKADSFEIPNITAFDMLSESTPWIAAALETGQVEGFHLENRDVEFADMGQELIAGYGNYIMNQASQLDTWLDSWGGNTDLTDKARKVVDWMASSMIENEYGNAEEIDFLTPMNLVAQDKSRRIMNQIINRDPELAGYINWQNRNGLPFLSDKATAMAKVANLLTAALPSLTLGMAEGALAGAVVGGVGAIPGAVVGGTRRALGLGKVLNNAKNTNKYRNMLTFGFGFGETGHKYLTKANRALKWAGKKATPANIASALPMITAETGALTQDLYGRYKDLGYSDEEAIELSKWSSGAYGVTAGLLERFSLGRIMARTKYKGLQSAVVNGLHKDISNARFGFSRAIRQGRGSVGADIGLASLSEGVTEWMQHGAELAVQTGFHGELYPELDFGREVFSGESGFSFLSGIVTGGLMSGVTKGALRKSDIRRDIKFENLSTRDKYDSLQKFARIQTNTILDAKQRESSLASMEDNIMDYMRHEPDYLEFVKAEFPAPAVDAIIQKYPHDPWKKVGDSGDEPPEDLPGDIKTEQPVTDINPRPEKQYDTGEEMIRDVILNAQGTIQISNMGNTADDSPARALQKKVGRTYGTKLGLDGWTTYAVLEMAKSKKDLDINKGDTLPDMVGKILGATGTSQDDVNLKFAVADIITRTLKTKFELGMDNLPEDSKFFDTLGGLLFGQPGTKLDPKTRKIDLGNKELESRIQAAILEDFEGDKAGQRQALSYIKDVIEYGDTKTMPGGKKGKGKTASRGEKSPKWYVRNSQEDIEKKRESRYEKNFKSMDDLWESPEDKSKNLNRDKWELDAKEVYPVGSTVKLEGFFKKSILNLFKDGSPVTAKVLGHEDHTETGITKGGQGLKVEFKNTETGKVEQRVIPAFPLESVNIYGNVHVLPYLSGGKGKAIISKLGQTTKETSDEDTMTMPLGGQGLPAPSKKIKKKQQKKKEKTTTSEESVDDILKKNSTILSDNNEDAITDNEITEEQQRINENIESNKSNNIPDWSDTTGDNVESISEEEVNLAIETNNYVLYGYRPDAPDVISTKLTFQRLLKIIYPDYDNTATLGELSEDVEARNKARVSMYDLLSGLNTNIKAEDLDLELLHFIGKQWNYSSREDMLRDFTSEYIQDSPDGDKIKKYIDMVNQIYDVIVHPINKELQARMELVSILRQTGRGKEISDAVGFPDNVDMAILKESESKYDYIFKHWLNQTAIEAAQVDPTDINDFLKTEGYDFDGIKSEMQATVDEKVDEQMDIEHAYHQERQKRLSELKPKLKEEFEAIASDIVEAIKDESGFIDFSAFIPKSQEDMINDNIIDEDTFFTKVDRAWELSKEYADISREEFFYSTRRIINNMQNISAGLRARLKNLFTRWARNRWSDMFYTHGRRRGLFRRPEPESAFQMLDRKMSQEADKHNWDRSIRKNAIKAATKQFTQEYVEIDEAERSLDDRDTDEDMVSLNNYKKIGGNIGEIIYEIQNHLDKILSVEEISELRDEVYNHDAFDDYLKWIQDNNYLPDDIPNQLLNQLKNQYHRDRNITLSENHNKRVVSNIEPVSRNKDGTVKIMGKRSNFDPSMMPKTEKNFKDNIDPRNNNQIPVTEVSTFIDDKTDIYDDSRTSELSSSDVIRVKTVIQKNDEKVRYDTLKTSKRAIYPLGSWIKDEIVRSILGYEGFPSWTRLVNAVNRKKKIKINFENREVMVSGKPGDNARTVFTKIMPQYTEWAKDLKGYLNKEFKAGAITKENIQEILDFVDDTLSQPVEHKIKGDKVSSTYRSFYESAIQFVKNSESLEGVPDWFTPEIAVAEQIITTHEFNKEIWHNDYYKTGLKNLENNYKRMSIPYALGTALSGYGDIKIQAIPLSTLKMKYQGRNLEIFGDYAETGSKEYRFNGQLWKSGNVNQKTKGQLGANIVNEVKSFLYHRDLDGTGITTVKALETEVREGVEWYDGNTLVAHSEKDSSGIVNIISDLPQNKGEIIDFLGTTEELKVNYHNQSDGIKSSYVKTIPEDSRKIQNFSTNKSKRTAPSPMNWFPKLYGLLMNNEEMMNNYSIIEDAYLNRTETGIEYAFEAIENPARLMQQFRESPDRMDLMNNSNLVNAIALAEKYGWKPDWIKHHYYAQDLEKGIINKFIKNMAFQGRREGYGTMGYVVGDITGQLKEDEIRVSRSNRTVYNQAVYHIRKAADENYYRLHGFTKDEHDIAKRIIPSLIGRTATGGLRISYSDGNLERINRFLKINPLEVTGLRQPITDPSAFRVLKVVELDSADGQFIVTNPKYTYKIIQGDNDGDKLNLLFFEGKELQALKDITNFIDNNFQSKIALEVFLTEKAGNVLSPHERHNYLHRNMVSSNDIGGVVNAVTFYQHILFKKINGIFTTNNKRISFRPVESKESIDMDFAPLDITNEAIKNRQFLDKGDSIVRLEIEGKERKLVEVKSDEELTENNTYYLRTTPTKFIANMVQATVDDVKFGLLQAWGLENVSTEIIQKLIVDGDGNRIEAEDLSRMMNKFKSELTWGSMLRLRGTKGARLPIGVMPKEAERLKDLYKEDTLSYSDKIMQRINDTITDKAKKDGFQLIKLNAEPNQTIQEKILMKYGDAVKKYGREVPLQSNRDITRSVQLSVAEELVKDNAKGENIFLEKHLKTAFNSVPKKDLKKVSIASKWLTYALQTMMAKFREQVTKGDADYNITSKTNDYSDVKNLMLEFFAPFYNGDKPLVEMLPESRQNAIRKALGNKSLKSILGNLTIKDYPIIVPLATFGLGTKQVRTMTQFGSSAQEKNRRNDTYFPPEELLDEKIFSEIMNKFSQHWSKAEARAKSETEARAQYDIAGKIEKVMRKYCG